MPSEKEIKESVEICVEVKRHIDNATLGFSGFTARQAVAFDRVLAIAQSVLDCKGFPEEREARYIDSPDAIRYNDESYLKTEGFNDALRLCKLAAAKDKMKIPSVGELEAAIYGKPTLEAARLIHKMIGGE